MTMKLAAGLVLMAALTGCGSSSSSSTSTGPLAAASQQCQHTYGDITILNGVFSSISAGKYSTPAAATQALDNAASVLSSNVDAAKSSNFDDIATATSGLKSAVDHVAANINPSTPGTLTDELAQVAAEIKAVHTACGHYPS